MDIICILLNVYWLILLVWVIASCLAPFAGEVGGVARGVHRVVRPLVEPVIRPLRGLVPPIRMGGMALDLSPIILFVVLGIVITSIGCGGIF
jgi:YggT family protein